MVSCRDNTLSGVCQHTHYVLQVMCQYFDMCGRKPTFGPLVNFLGRNWVLRLTCRGQWPAENKFFDQINSKLWTTLDRLAESPQRTTFDVFGLYVMK